MNPNIALSVQRPRFNALAAKNTAAQMQAAQQQGQLNALKLASAQQDMARQGKLRNALSRVNLQNSDGTINYTALAQAHIGAGDVAGGAGWLEKGYEADSRRITKQKDRLGLLAEQNNVIASTLGAVDSQESLDAARATLEGYGIGTRGIPEVYQKDAIDALRLRALDANQQLTLQMKRDEFAYRKDQDAESNRRAEENLGIRRREAGAAEEAAQAQSTLADYKVREAKRKDDEAVASEQANKEILGEAYAITQRLLDPSKRKSLKRSVGVVDSFLPTIRQGTKNAEIELENLRAILTKDNLSLLSGVMSDSDIRFLTKIAAGKLDPGIGDDEIVSRLMSAAKSLKRYAEFATDLPKPSRPNRRGQGPSSPKISIISVESLNSGP